MKYQYDQKTDIFLFVLSTDPADFAEQSENIITHYNKNGKPIEIEILDASKTMLNMLETVFNAKKVPLFQAKALENCYPTNPSFTSFVLISSF